MADVQEIVELLQAKVKHLDELRRQVREAEDELAEVRRMLGGYSVRRYRMGARSLQPGSLTHQAFQAISQANAPMHIDDIVKSIGCESRRKATLVSNISRYVQAGVLFRRTAANTFDVVTT